jgi:hypothetical protein
MRTDGDRPAGAAGEPVPGRAGRGRHAGDGTIPDDVIFIGGDPFEIDAKILNSLAPRRIRCSISARVPRRAVARTV